MAPLLDTLTLLAFFAITVDVLFQVFHIFRRKSSADVSLKGASIRFAAGAIFTWKYFSIGDFVLIAGQIVFIVSYAMYFGLLVRYRSTSHRSG